LGDGILLSGPAADSPPDRFRHDPLDPVMSVGGATIHQELLPDGVQDQAEIEKREDVLVYTSPVLAGMTVAGPVVVVLHAATTAVDTDFTAKLVDVEVDGYCANVAEGIIRARFRAGLDKELLVKPGSVEEYRIELNDVAYTFKAGHRLRLVVASSNFPKYARNLNIEGNPNEAAANDAVVAIQTIYHDGDHPSRLILPV